MFPVNVMPKHQRLERIGHKNSEQSFTVNERKKKKRRFTGGHAETNWFEWSVRAKVMFLVNAGERGWNWF